jgi:hypothetical protein
MMLLLTFTLLAAAFISVVSAQNETEIESTVDFLFPSYCVSHTLWFVATLTLSSALS